MACFKVDAFLSAGRVRAKKEVGEFIRYLKETPPAEGSSGVLYPGEIEHMKEQDSAKPTASTSRPATWTRLKLLAEEYKLLDQLGMGDVE